ncbi:MAG: cytochrome-c peroxidase, partial [Planctomycetota bacterium]|nr:cytochrome-c peroxidase [Planctomycetota bacterium]
MNLRSRPWLPIIVIVTGLGILQSQLHPGVTTAIEFSTDELATIQSLTGLGPPPPSPTNRFADNPKAAQFGRQLFFDSRLSSNGQISCATCHDPAKDFTDGRATARGLGETTRNTPTILNAAHGFWAFWDGRADSLWAQALGPIEHPAEMGSSRGALWQLVRTDAALRSRYQEIFAALPSLETANLPPHAKPGTPGWDALPIGDRHILDSFFANLGKAIAAFERTLQTSDAPFDHFARGLREGRQDLVDALSPAAQRGLKLFLGRGQCTLCHFGPNFSDGEFHNI